MADPFLGEIKLVPYNFAPLGWAFCHGQLLAISQNTALFSLLGTTYGGNGQTTFALPDLRGRAVVHTGQGPGLSPYDLGEMSGVENVTLTTSEMPAHSHAMQVSDQAATLATVSGNYPGVGTGSVGNVYGTAPNGSMPANAVSPTGGAIPHNNRQPYLTMNYIIALQGIFPQRN